MLQRTIDELDGYKQRIKYLEERMERQEQLVHDFLAASGFTIKWYGKRAEFEVVKAGS